MLISYLPFRLNASLIGEGPIFFIRSVNSEQISAHLEPMAADKLNISSRSGSILT
jgi:hypothetical protein